MKRSLLKVLAPVGVLATLGTAQVVAAGTTEPPDTTAAAEEPAGDSLLDEVRSRDSLRCGVRVDLVGFNSVDENGEQTGFDADFCRVVAAAVLGDSTKVEFANIESGDARFPALQSREIDVLIRNTTWTASRDGTEGATFLHPVFYDGQGMMVAADGGYESIDDMDGAVVCVVAGTTTEGNVSTEFAARGLTVDVQSFEDIGLLQEAWIAGSCDGWSSDTSQLNSVRSSFPDADGGPDSLVILEGVFSKEPLAPAVLDGDSRWADAVNWAIFSTIQAEEFGVTSENAEEMAAGDDPAIAAFLGAPNADGTVVDPGLGLDPAFALNVVTQVGNYGEIFDRNLTQTIGIERGLNALWTDGGLQYAPPYR